MEVVIDALDHTPWWVYALFILLLLRAVKAMRDATVSLFKLAIFPVVLTSLGLVNLVTTFPISPLTLGTWSLAAAVGGTLGWTYAGSRPLRADAAAGKVWRQGSKVPLFIMLTVFATKYTFGYAMEARPDLVSDPAFYLTDLAVSGLFSGFLFGQLANTWARMHSPLTPPISEVVS